MAQAIDFLERNDYIGKPPSMTDNQCYSLPVSRILTHIPGPTDHDKSQKTLAHVSCWKLSDEELEEVKRTGVVYVKIIGTTLYPMSVHGTKPIYPGEGGVSDTLFTAEEIEQMKNGDKN